MKIDHVAIYVTDLDGARAFFEDYFGGTSNSMYHNPRTGLRTYFITFSDGSRLEIMSRPEVAAEDFRQFRHGLVHIAFNLGSATCVDTLTARLAKAGFEVLSGPRTTGDGYYESSVRAFEGIVIELTV